MKKFIILTLILSLLLFSCGQDRENGVFDYQKKLSRVSGAVEENGREYTVELCFTQSPKGNTLCRRIEFSSPEDIAGLSFTLEGENVTAELEGVRISDTWFDPEKVFRFARLFSLCEDDIFDIKTKKDNRTYIKGKNSGCTFEAVTKKNGTPERITLQTAEGTTVIRISSIILNK